uniref:FBD domain-containing protein n=1 Tax=Leersia perrieri TaxID=77586 RepID=A0A0D9V2J8_9ORYZ
MSVAEELDVVVAPRLERLVLWNEFPYPRRVSHDFRMRVKIGYTPELKMLGYLELGIHVLVIANTVIEDGAKPSHRTMVPTVKVLALKVRFGVRQEAKMLLTFLRCFPRVETLHIMSAESDEPTGKLNSKFMFCQDVVPIECLKSHIKKVVFKNFRGEGSELAFLRFVLERAQLLQTLVVVLADEGGDHASQEEVGNRLKPLIYSTRRASRCTNFVIFVHSGGSAWNFRTASDLSRSDPFDC